MKGLLLKDMYMIRKYCRAYLIILIVFLGVSYVKEGNMFLSIYPCILSGMIPVTLLSYDERSRWTIYSGTLPYSKAQIVSVKYLVGIIAQITVLILSGIVQAVRMNIDGNFVIKEYLAFMGMLLIMSCFAPSISLPCMFKLGVERGRIIYYILIGIICGASIAVMGVGDGNVQLKMRFDRVLPIVCIAAVVWYVLSWYLSIVLYKKRELN